MTVLEHRAKPLPMPRSLMQALNRLAARINRPFVQHVLAREPKPWVGK